MPLISDSIGRVLGARYRLVSALGSGASAHVYLAEDVILQRRVAVKVLQPTLARDEGFLRRFRAEARAVAALNHPHVVRVFDWGEDADGPYLVVEHLGGGSLRDLLDRGVRLDPAQAASVGAQVADALAYAHARGLVHRDVKPANLLFDEEGRVRVADFGVARALAEAAATEPAGAMIGTARYASPEQAEGRSLDGKSDVYALALVLCEAVTGQVPFAADTTTATLQARIGAALPADPALGPLADLLVAAAAPDATDRLDATDLGEQLRSLPLPPPAPIPVSAAPTPRGRFLLPGDGTAMLPGDGTAMLPGEGTAMLPGEGTAMLPGDGTAMVPPVGPPTGMVPVGTPPVAAAVPRRRRWPWVLVAVVVLLAAAAGAAAIETKYFVPSHRVPNLYGKPVAEARSAAAADHFHLSVAAPVRSVGVPTGRVVRQRPAAGTSLKQGDTLTVVPSSGLPTVTVPSLSSLNCTGAERLLATSHLKAICPALTAYTNTTPAGQVVNWSYKTDPQLDPTKAPYGSTIAIAVSLGHHPVKVPALANGTFPAATAALRALGLQASETQTYSTTVPAGQVISTAPPAGATAPFGSTIQVKVSKGAQTVTVPTLTGQTVSQATATLKKHNLTVGSIYGPAHGKVFATVPVGGESVKPGTPVDLYTK